MELAERGVGFNLEELPRLARLVWRILEEDVDRRPARVVSVRPAAAPTPDRPEQQPHLVAVAP